MIGRRYKHKQTGAEWQVVADNQDGRWVLTPVDFGPNVPYSPQELREFTRAQDAEPPAAPSYYAETEGWQRLSAEARFRAIADAAESGSLQVGDTLTVPGFDGEPIDATAPLTKQDVGRLRAAARKLRGPVQPTPEETFSRQQVDAIQAAADKVWNSDDGPDGLLARYEIGALEVGPAVREVLDRRIRERNRLEDRETYPNAHVFDRGQR